MECAPAYEYQLLTGTLVNEKNNERASFSRLHLCMKALLVTRCESLSDTKVKVEVRVFKSLLDLERALDPEMVYGMYEKNMKQM